MTLGRSAARLGIGLTVALAAAGCGSGGESDGSAAPTTTATTTVCVKNEQGTACLPIAPDSARVDLARPTFANPTRITNTRFPVGVLTQVLQLGQEGGEPLRVEVTRLPRARAITWDGQRVDTVASQYVAYVDHRIREVAIDYYAQADDGAVWYFGEDVANYEDGVVADHDGTWLTGKDGPPGMIMPGDPEVGAVYRPENIPGKVFEQDTIRSTDETVDGPRGPVQGALLVEELLMDGTTEEKVFAPGYGEFRARAKDELVTVTLALPVDAAAGTPPADLVALTDGARATTEAVAAGRWTAASARVDTMAAAWKRTRGGEVPKLLAGQMSEAVGALAKAVDARDPARARQAALRVEQAALDLQLRYRPPAEVDLERLDLWARQLLVDAAARDRGAVAGDVATLQALWDRAGHAVDPASAERVTAALAALRKAADGNDLESAAGAVPALRAGLWQLRG
jgi:hypothetical protein